MESSGAFIASKEMSESLRLDMSVLSPEEDDLVRSLTKDIIHEYANRYRNLIPTETINKIYNIEDRVIVTDEEKLQLFGNNWGNKPPRSNFHGLRSPHGDIIVMQKPDDYWSQLSVESKHKISTYTPEEEAKKTIRRAAYASTITHEIAHSLSSKFGMGRLPVWFDECGAEYYEEEIQRQLRLDLFVDLDEHIVKRREIYKNLVTQYGDDVHRAYFGSVLDGERKNQMFLSVPIMHLTQAQFTDVEMQSLVQSDSTITQ